MFRAELSIPIESDVQLGREIILTYQMRGCAILNETLNRNAQQPVRTVLPSVPLRYRLDAVSDSSPEQFAGQFKFSLSQFVIY